MSLTQRLFTDSFRDLQRTMSASEQPLFHVGRLLGGTQHVFRYPSTDMVETPEAYELYCELAGYDKKNIKIELADDHRTLILNGSINEVYEVKPEKEEEGEKEGQATAKKEGEASPTKKEGQAATKKEGEASPIKKEGQASTKKEDQAATMKEGESEVKKGTKDEAQVTTKKDEDTQVSKRQKTPQWWVNERIVGSFTRSFTFPTPIKPDGIKATFENGILKTVAPKATEGQAKQINIE